MTMDNRGKTDESSQRQSLQAYSAEGKEARRSVEILSTALGKHAYFIRRMGWIHADIRHGLCLTLEC